jgi:hypothetical protein
MVRCFVLLLPNYWTASTEYRARSTGCVMTQALGCRPLIREGPRSIKMQWTFGGGKRLWEMVFSNYIDFYPVSITLPGLKSLCPLSVSFCQCFCQFVPCQYDYAGVSVNLFPVSMIMSVLLSICSLSVWLCQCFCQFVPCQCNYVSVSVNLFPVSIIMPVFLLICSLSVWLC